MSEVEMARPSLRARLRWRLTSLKMRIKQWIGDQALKVIVFVNRDSNYLSHLRNEVPHWFDEPDDDPNRWMAEGTEQLLAVFAHQGHSGMSASFARQFFDAMAKFHPWGPLTGEKHEWNHVHDETWQNRRCSHIFVENPRWNEEGALIGGIAYDIEGIVWREESGATFTNRGSHTRISFPWNVPLKPMIRDVPAGETDDEEPSEGPDEPPPDAA